MCLPGSDITSAERGANNFDSNLLRLRRVHFNFLHHQRLSSSPCNRSCFSQYSTVISNNNQIKMKNKKMGMSHFCLQMWFTFASDDLRLLDGSWHSRKESEEDKCDPRRSRSSEFAETLVGMMMMSLSSICWKSGGSWWEVR